MWDLQIQSNIIYINNQPLFPSLETTFCKKPIFQECWNQR